MAITGSLTPTAIDGIQNDASVQNFSNKIGTANTYQPQVIVAAGRQLAFAGQTQNTSGSSVADQAIGTASIPATSIGASTQANNPQVIAVTVPNALIGAKSMVFVQLQGDGKDAGNNARIIGHAVPSSGLVAATTGVSGSFAVNFYAINSNAGAISTVAVDFNYWIVN